MQEIAVALTLWTCAETDLNVVFYDQLNNSMK